MEKTLAGLSIETNEEGYLKNFEEWNKAVGIDIAAEEGISMTNEHWEVIDFIQDQFRQEKALSIRGIKKGGVINIKDFYRLFPGGPLKKASKIAGIPKPVSCI